MPNHSDRIGRLFETAHPESDPEGLITNFLAFEYSRIHGDTKTINLRGSLQARLRILFWYLYDYNRQRRYHYRLPLSRHQIAYLNGPAPIAGAPAAVTVALFNGVIANRPRDRDADFGDFTDAGFVEKSVYWWCCEKAPLLRVERSLVTDAHIDILRTIKGPPGTEFPLNLYMSRVLDTVPAFGDLDMTQPRCRAALYCYLLLEAFTQPSILRFLPSDWLREALLQQNLHPSFFEQVLARYAVADGPDRLADAAALKAKGLALITQAGVPLRPRRVNGIETNDVGECLDADYPVTTAIEPGVAVIGPVMKASGLGQAVRVSLGMLAHVEQSMPTVLDFDLDNPAPVVSTGRNAYQAYRNRRSINILHLNADVIPLCFAFKPRSVFSDSYNIGYFFWELNEIPDCQRLALDLLNEIWVASEFNRAIYARFTTKPVVNVGMALARLPVVAAMDRETFGIAADTIIFLSTFDSFSFIERKNPLGIIAAFSAAFPTGMENVVLILKTQNRTRIADAYQAEVWTTIDARARADRRIVLLDDTYRYEDIVALMRMSDCYVSLHRAEGFGFGLIEAMQMQKPVVCTAYSGNLEFCNDTTAFMVEYDLVPVQRDEYLNVPRGSVWADPDIGRAAEHMRTIATNPVSARAKGEAAARFVNDRFSIEAGARRYQARLADIRQAL